MVVNDHITADSAGQDGRHRLFRATGNGLYLSDNTLNIGLADKEDFVAFGTGYFMAHQQQRVIGKVFIHRFTGLLWLKSGAFKGINCR